MDSLPRLLLLNILLLLSHSSLSHSSTSPFTSFAKTPSFNSNPTSPLSPKASLLRYWNRKVPNNQPRPAFFLSKLSPLSPLDAATYSSISPDNLSSKLSTFCSSAHLLCQSTSLSSPSLAAHDGPSDFKAYVDSNFTNYATDGTGFTSSFANYSDDQNIPVGSQDSFTSYSPDGNVVTTNFTSYSTFATGGTGEFSGYHTNSNVPDLKFTNYDNVANGFVRDFLSYTTNSNSGNENFAGYGKHGNGVPTTFAGDVRRIFNIREDTAMGKAIGDTVAECERAPSRGETKRCPTSAEDMIDFAVSVLGSNVVVRSTENTEGSKGDIMIGDVKGVNGGKVTESVSCHQSLFPYLVYYCHSVPKVRVYQADILDVDSKQKINHGVAICHIDTLDWSAGHGAFVALGSAPGQIEVCHWIFEGDMTWARAD